jgi:ABC-type phosphate transport system auxiliary subunit
MKMDAIVLLIGLLAFIALDFAAYFWGADSRDG